MAIVDLPVSTRANLPVSTRSLTIVKRCRRCRQPMRNDGTEANPVWVCNNPSCVCYVPPAEDNGEEDSEDSAE